MLLSEAVSKRLKEILKQKGISQYRLSQMTGVPQSTITSIKKCENKSVILATIYEICSGINMELKEFFDAEYFLLENLSN